VNLLALFVSYTTQKLQLKLLESK